MARIANNIAAAIKVLTAVAAVALLALATVNASLAPSWCPDNVNPTHCVTGN